MPRRSRKSSRRAARYGSSVVFDYVSGIANAGSQQDIRFKGTRLPTNRPYRVVSAALQCVSKSSTTVELCLYSPQGTSSAMTACSGPQLVGRTVRHIHCSNKQNKLFFTSGTSEAIIVSIINVCNGEKPSPDGVIEYSVKIAIQLGTEMISSACPTNLSVTSKPLVSSETSVDPENDLDDLKHDFHSFNLETDFHSSVST